MIYVGKTYTARLRGSRICPVLCEKCQTPFLYELIREAVGSGSAPYYIGQASAAARAENGARKMLEKRLSKESEPVACPHCQWVNADLVAGYRRSRFRGLGVTAVIAGFVIALFVLIGVATGGHRYDNNFVPGLVYGLISGAVVAGIFLGLQWLLRSRVNPNKHFPNPPKLPAGTPKGYTQEALTAAAATAQSDRFVPADPAASDFPDWVVFRAGHLTLPPVCCECLAPPTRYFKAEGSNKLNAFAAPLCDECDSRIKAHRRMIFLQAIAAAAILTGSVYFLVNGKQDDRVILTCVAGLVAGIAALIIASLLGRPFALKTVDGARSVFRVKFRSEQYTEMVRKATSDHEAARFKPPGIPQRVIPMN